MTPHPLLPICKSKILVLFSLHWIKWIKKLSNLLLDWRLQCLNSFMFVYWYVSDIAGQGDGSVSIWEWGHVGVVSQPRAAGAYAKVNRLRFNSQGNKFGVADGDGHVALWTLRLGGGNVPHRPFFVRFIWFIGIFNTFDIVYFFIIFYFSSSSVCVYSFKSYLYIVCALFTTFIIFNDK